MVVEEREGNGNKNLSAAASFHERRAILSAESVRVELIVGYRTFSSLFQFHQLGYKLQA